MYDMSVALPLKQNMYKLLKYYMALYGHFLVMYDTQSGITVGDALM
jgi:hypothetical protein